MSETDSVCRTVGSMRNCFPKSLLRSLLIYRAVDYDPSVTLRVPPSFTQGGAFCGSPQSYGRSRFRTKGKKTARTVVLAVSFSFSHGQQSESAYCNEVSPACSCGRCFTNSQNEAKPPVCGTLQRCRMIARSLPVRQIKRLHKTCIGQ